MYKLIRNALGDAYRKELVTRNVAMQVKAPPLGEERRVGLDMAEARRLLDVIDGERLEALYVLAMTTGLRRGELKTSSWRIVVLPRFAVRHLQEHKKRQDAEREALGDAWHEHGLVFASSIGSVCR